MTEPMMPVKVYLPRTLYRDLYMHAAVRNTDVAGLLARLAAASIKTADTPQKKTGPGSGLTQDHLDVAITLRGRGYSYNAIGRLLGFAGGTISRALKRAGVQDD